MAALQRPLESSWGFSIWLGPDFSFGKTFFSCRRSLIPLYTCPRRPLPTWVYPSPFSLSPSIPVFPALVFIPPSSVSPHGLACFCFHSLPITSAPLSPFPVPVCPSPPGQQTAPPALHPELSLLSTIPPPPSANAPSCVVFIACMTALVLHPIFPSKAFTARLLFLY